MQTAKHRNDLIYEWDLCEERASPESLKRTIGKTRRVTLAATSPTVAAPEARRRRASSAAAAYSSSSSNLVVGHSSKSRKVLTLITHVFLFSQSFIALLSLSKFLFSSFLSLPKAVMCHSLIYQIYIPSFVFLENRTTIFMQRRDIRGWAGTSQPTKPSLQSHKTPSLPPVREG